MYFKFNEQIFFYYVIYLFMRHTEREREAETQAEGEAGSMQAGSMQDSISGLQDHALGPRQALNR